MARGKKPRSRALPSVERQERPRRWGTGIHVPPAYAQHPVGCISCDSREGMPDGLFVALPGFKVNGADFIREAVRQGARTIVKQQAGRALGDYTIPDDVCVLDTADTKAF